MRGEERGQQPVAIGTTGCIRMGDSLAIELRRGCPERERDGEEERGRAGETERAFVKNLHSLFTITLIDLHW